MLLRPHTKIPYHLHGLGMLHLDMALLNHALHKMLMNELPKRAPQRSILHSQQMAAAGNRMGNMGFWPVAVLGAFSVDELLDDAAIGDYDGGSGS